MQKNRQQKKKKWRSFPSPQRIKEPKVSSAELFMAGGNVWDQRCKFIYFIPHQPQKPDEASIFGMYTPGLHSSANLISFVTQLPSDVREIFSDARTILHLRLRRLLWRHIAPIDVNSLIETSHIGIPLLFRVVLSHDKETADAIDKMKFIDGVPFLHVSSLPGIGRVLGKEFDQSHLLVFIRTVLAHLSAKPELSAFVHAVEETMQDEFRQQQEPLNMPRAFHNVTAPNELALMSFGRLLVGDDPLVPKVFSDQKGNPQRYIDRICLTADTVIHEREKLMVNLPAQLNDWTYIISVPSIHWNHYQKGRMLGKNLSHDDRKFFNIAYKNAIQQSTYFDQIEVSDSEALLKNKFFQGILSSRAADQNCYTTGLTILSSSTLAPVLRLEPKLNQVRGEFKMLAHCSRATGRIRLQDKLSRLAKAAGHRMRSLIDSKFLDRIDKYNSSSSIQGLKLVSDVPLEWLPCDGIPLGLRYDLSRTPVMPGNLFLINCINPPIFIDVEELFDILVIRSFRPDDQLKSLLKESIECVIEEVENRKKVRFVDVESAEELISALETFKGGILIFDGHGSYDKDYGIGSFVIGGASIDVWSLKGRCHFPPIVIFSACDTHPIDGSHGSCANAAFTLGAVTVLATSLPIHGGLAAIFIARLILRIFEFIPLALKDRDILTWRDVVSGMLRMSYTSEVTRMLITYAKISLDSEARNRVQLRANTVINKRRSDWFELYLHSLSQECKLNREQILGMIERWASITDALKYIQLGSPENIVITKNQ